MVAGEKPPIFVHIQRTGGNAIRAALGLPLFAPHKHFRARELRTIYGEATWRDSFKFAFVRNPWERLVSWWSLIDNGRDPAGATPAPNNFFAYVLTHARSFDEFLANCTDEIVDADGRKQIFRNQIDYLVDEDDKIIVDFVGRFERLQRDFDTVAAQLGLQNLALPRLNESRHGAYADFYSLPMAKKVARYYSRDIEAFGYQFGK